MRWKKLSQQLYQVSSDNDAASQHVGNSVSNRNCTASLGLWQCSFNLSLLSWLAAHFCRSQQVAALDRDRKIRSRLLPRFTITMHSAFNSIELHVPTKPRSSTRHPTRLSIWSKKMCSMPYLSLSLSVSFSFCPSYLFHLRFVVQKRRCSSTHHPTRSRVLSQQDL